jgi:hypothetical protein
MYGWRYATTNYQRVLILIKLEIYTKMLNLNVQPIENLKVPHVEIQDLDVGLVLLLEKTSQWEI